MRRRGLSILSTAGLALVLALGLVSTAAPAGAATGAAPAAAPVAPTATSGVVRLPDSYDQRVLYWTNRARRNAGRTPLRLMTCLDGKATSWSRVMATQRMLRHQNLSVVLRDCRRTRVAENIAWGGSSMTPRQLVRMWMRSSGHRANILSRTYRYVGIAEHRATNGRIYASQVFGR